GGGERVEPLGEAGAPVRGEGRRVGGRLLRRPGRRVLGGRPRERQRQPADVVDERAERGPVARRRRGELVVADAREQGGHPPRGGREVGHRGHAGTSVVGSGPVAGGGSAAGEPARVPGRGAGRRLRSTGRPPIGTWDAPDTHRSTEYVRYGWRDARPGRRRRVRQPRTVGVLTCEC